MTDELLVVRAQLGERAALAELVARWQAPVWTYVRRMLDAGRADDVSQEIWLAVIRGLPRLREPARFAPWLFTIARRSVVERLRSQYAREEEGLARGDVAVDDLAAEGRHQSPLPFGPATSTREADRPGRRDVREDLPLRLPAGARINVRRPCGGTQD
jgi:RNA polymerase sigma factor (sigma-70 family)